MIKPNFFVAGAPKSGTSSLYSYLKEHPLVLMSWLKEPLYFLSDHPGMQAVTTLDEYLALFKGDDKTQYMAVGEASTLYLESTTALKNIHDYDCHSRIIVLLRNPVDLVYSFHSQLYYSLDENEPDFAEAWQLQSSRRIGRKVPSKCRDPYYLQYKKIGQLGRQVQGLLNIFPKEQVKLLLFDDFKAATREVYEDVLAFLDVPSDDRKEFPHYNVNRQHRSERIGTWLMKPPQFVLLLRDKTNLQGTGVIQKLMTLSARTEVRPALAPELRAEIVEVFKGEIDKLAEVLDRDLSNWLESE